MASPGNDGIERYLVLSLGRLLVSGLNRFLAQRCQTPSRVKAKLCLVCDFSSTAASAEIGVGGPTELGVPGRPRCYWAVRRLIFPPTSWEDRDGPAKEEQ
jgi:hypothetical protein